MATYFHIAGASYEPGSDLLCWDELEAAGYEPEWKWDGEPFDTDVVCLFASIAEARDAIEAGLFAADARILQVEVPGDAYTVTVSEGYTAIPRRIPAEWISRTVEATGQ